ncbi:MAG: DUF4382 domain-containing protein [Thermoplasmataceae archaeon]
MSKSSKTAIAVVISALVISAGAYVYFSQYYNKGVMNVYVQDTPLTNVNAVYVTFSAVAVHGNASGWVNFTTGKTTVNILNLDTTNASLLKSVSLSAQTFTMIRLYISSVNVTVLGINISLILSAPFAFVNHPFTVSAHSTTVVHIDFNLINDINLQSRVFTPYVGITVS